MSTQAVEAAVPVREKRKKKLVRRAAPDQSQRIRHIVQLTFVAINLWIGAQFFL